MERFSSRERVQLGYGPSRSFAEDPAASPSSSSFSDAVVDFHDVFGGPPRRVSIQDGRYSFNSDGVDDGVGRRGSDEQFERRRSPWGGGLGFGEKPVFGEASSGAQRRKTSDDFFDDIFRGDTSSDSPNAVLKKRDFYSSSVPADVFGGSSVATQSSMPGKVGKGMEVPMFTSVSSSPRRSRDNYPPSPALQSSRLSRHGSLSQSDLTNEAQFFYSQSPLSVEFSFANDGSVKVTKTDMGDEEDIVKQNSTISDSILNSNQFHFSIYKWASKGAPPMIPIRGGVNFRLRDKSTKKSLNDDGKQEGDGETEHVVADEVVASARVTELKNSSSSRRNLKKKDDELTSTMESEGVVDEDLNSNVEEKEATSRVPDPSIKPANIVKNISEDFNYHEIRARSKSRIVADLVNDESNEDETTGPEIENQKSGLTNAIIENEGQAENQATSEAGAKPKGTTLFSRFASLGSYIKKQDTKGTISETNSDVDKTSVPSSPGENSRRRKVKEKVKEFVEMFNQDSSSFKTKMDADINSQSSEWNDKNSNKGNVGVSVSTKRTGKDISKPKLDKKSELSNAYDMVDKKIKQETMSTLVDKKKMSPTTYSKVENDTMSPKAKKDMTNFTDSMVDRNINSTAVPIPDQKKKRLQSAIEHNKITTATKVKMDSAQSKKSSSRGADIFTETNLSFPPPTEHKRDAYRNDSPMESKKTDPINSYNVDNKAYRFKKKENEEPLKESGIPVRKDTSSKQKDVSSQGTGSSLPDKYQDANESLLDPIDAFEIKELTEELSSISQMDEYQLALQESDAKIRQWSRGKEGNIRSLLSTLQHVLWPGSGWKPVALMDIIEANQVKRTYQRALLCLHPDKLQQKGAAEHQKYIAGKVFDILQESWNHFNTLTSL